jgi:hypothetical protein
MSDDIFGDESIDDLVSQLKENNKIINTVKKERTEISADNLEEFIMKSSGALIEDSLEVISNVKDYTSSAPDSREATSLAELIRASASAIDILNKILLQNKKSDAQMDIKKLDVNMKQGIAAADNATTLLVSREDILNKLIEDSDAIEVEVSDDTE